MAIAPKIIKIPSATIFVSDIQNSLTEKILISSILSNKIKTEKTAHHTQIGVCGNHFWRQTPIVINCEPSATVQVNQYSQATVKPRLGWIYFEACVGGIQRKVRI